MLYCLALFPVQVRTGSPPHILISFTALWSSLLCARFTIIVGLLTKARFADVLRDAILGGSQIPWVRHLRRNRSAIFNLRPCLIAGSLSL